MKEKIKIHNPHKKFRKCIGNRVQDKKKLHLIFLKTINGRNFQFIKILSCWVFPYPQKKYFQVHPQARPVAKLPVVDFTLSATRNAYTKATECRTLIFSFRI